MRGLWGDIEMFFCFGDVAKIMLTFYALQGIKRVKSKSRTAALGGSREGGYSQKEVHQIQSSLHQTPSLNPAPGMELAVPGRGGCGWGRGGGGGGGGP